MSPEADPEASGNSVSMINEMALSVSILSPLHPAWNMDVVVSGAVATLFDHEKKANRIAEMLA